MTAVLLATALLAGWPFVPAVTAADTASPPAAGSPDAFFPQPSHDFGSVLEDSVVEHTFQVKNRGQGPLKLERVQTS